MSPPPEHLAYDALSRLRDVSDGRVHIGIEYDAVGNCTHICSYTDIATVTGATATVELVSPGQWVTEEVGGDSVSFNAISITPSGAPGSTRSVDNLLHSHQPPLRPCSFQF